MSQHSNQEPNPIEDLHGRLMELFHEYRLSKTQDLKVEIDGQEFNKIIAQAKTDIYKKFPTGKYYKF